MRGWEGGRADVGGPSGRLTDAFAPGFDYRFNTGMSVEVPHWTPPVPPFE